MSKKQKNNSSNSVPELVQGNTVPLISIVIYVVCISISGFSPGYLLDEIAMRLGRDAFSILSPLIPITMGIGSDFGMALGVMVREIDLIFVADWRIWGIPGIILAMIISIPISALLGLFHDKIFNMVRDRGVITGYIIGLFMNGLYQLAVLYMTGSIIPITHSSIKLLRGYGVCNTASLPHIRQHLNGFLAIHIGDAKIPTLTLIIIALLCLFIIWFRKTKLGQGMRAVGQDMNVVGDVEVRIERIRVIAIIMLTVFAGLGMAIYLQNMGSVFTYNSHTQIGIFYIVALLVGEASVDRVSTGNIFLGVILFHLMFIVALKVSVTIIGSSMIGEYPRVFISCGAIAAILIVYETKKRRSKSKAGQMFQFTQSEEREN